MRLGVFAALLLVWQLVCGFFACRPTCCVSMGGDENGWRAIPSLVSSFLITAEEGGGRTCGSIVVGVAWRWCLRSRGGCGGCCIVTLLLQTVPIVAVAALILMWFARAHLR